MSWVQSNIFRSDAYTPLRMTVDVTLGKQTYSRTTSYCLGEGPDKELPAFVCVCLISLLTSTALQDNATHFWSVVWCFIAILVTVYFEFCRIYAECIGCVLRGTWPLNLHRQTELWKTFIQTFIRSFILLLCRTMVGKEGIASRDVGTTSRLLLLLICVKKHKEWAWVVACES